MIGEQATTQMNSPRDNGAVLLVGSIARPEDGWTVEDVFRHSAESLGPYVSMLPDGEIGDRSTWITYIARHVYYGHPDLVTLSRHTFEDWKPKALQRPMAVRRPPTQSTRCGSHGSATPTRPSGPTSSSDGFANRA